MASLLCALCATCLGACAPSYMKPSELEQSNVGPKQCAARCDELGLRMGALVLVPGAQPGCVCQPKRQQDDTKPAGTDAATTAGDDSVTASSAAKVVIDTAVDKKTQEEKQVIEHQ